MIAEPALHFGDDERAAAFRAFLERHRGESHLVVLQDFPDPEAIASGSGKSCRTTRCDSPRCRSRKARKAAARSSSPKWSAGSAIMKESPALREASAYYSAASPCCMSGPG